MSDKTLAKINFVVTTYVAPIVGAVASVFAGPLIGALVSTSIKLKSALMMELFYNPNPSMGDGPSAAPIHPLAGKDVSQPANYGSPIQQIWGRARVVGSLLAVGPSKIVNDSVLVWTDVVGRFRVSKKRKAGGLYQLARLEAPICTFAVLIGGPITAVHRIWFNGSLVYDRTVFGDSRVQYRTTSAYFTVYFGTDDQMPDPDLGGDVAYRGRSYIVFKNVSLAEFNNRIPEVVVEVSGADIGYQYTDSDDYYNEYFVYNTSKKIYRLHDKTGDVEVKHEYTVSYNNNGDLDVIDNSGNSINVTAPADEKPWEYIPLPYRDVTDPVGAVYEVVNSVFVGIAYPKVVWRLFDRSDGLFNDRYWLPGPDEIPDRFFGSGYNIHEKFAHEKNRRQFFGALFDYNDTWFMRDQLTNGDSIKLNGRLVRFKLGNEQVIHFKKDNTVPHNYIYPFVPEKQKLNLWALSEEKIPLSFPLAWILKQIGFSDDEIDVSETATIKAKAVVLRSAHSAETLLAHLCNAYHLTVCESEGKIKIRPENQPVWNRDYSNCLISEDGLTVNSLHDVPGRDGYFSSACGTSEGQFTMGRGACEAYLTTNNPDWLEFAVRLGDAALSKLYITNQSNPNALFVPHWLFVTKRPIKLDSAILYANLKDEGGVVTIPPNDPFNGDKIKHVKRVGNGWGAYLWENVEADLVYIGYAPSVIVSSYQGKGASWYWQRDYVTTVCDKWAYDDKGNPIACVESHNEYAWSANPQLIDDSLWSSYGSYTIFTYIDMGKVTPPPSDKPLLPPTITRYATDFEITDIDVSTGVVRFQQRQGQKYPAQKPRVFVSYVRSEVGEYAHAGSLIEAWPYWRTMRRGEVAGAGDSLFWGYDFYSLLHSITGDQKFNDAASATAQTTINVHNVDDGRYWWFVFPGSNEFFVDNSIFFRTERSSMSKNLLGRDASTGEATVMVPIGRGEVQIGRGINDVDLLPTDELMVEIELLYANTTIWRYGFDPQGVLAETGIAIWFDTSQVFNPANRYITDLGEPLKLGKNVVTIPISAFTTKLDPADPTRQYAGGAIYAFGISVFQEDLEVRFKLGNVRTKRSVTLPYVPGAPIYTVNTYLGNKVPWSGVPGIGYAYPHFWAKLNRTTELANLTQFLVDAANEYETRTGERGWMVPAFYWKRFDNIEYGTPGTWGWNWVDPNSQWGGYFYRNLVSMAEAGTPALANLAIERLLRIWADWPGWPQYIITDVKGETLPVWAPNTKFEWRGYNGNSDIIRPTTVNGRVYKPIQNGVSGSVEPAWPTTIGSTVTDGSIVWECTGYQYGVGAYGNYHEPHFASLILRAVYYLDSAGLIPSADRAKILEVGRRCFDYLDALYRNNVNDTMYGSFAEPNNNWWGFWHGEIVITISVILRSSWNPGAWLDRTKLTEWLDGSLQFWKRWDRKRYGD